MSIKASATGPGDAHVQDSDRVDVLGGHRDRVDVLGGHRDRECSRPQSQQGALESHPVRHGGSGHSTQTPTGAGHVCLWLSITVCGFLTISVVVSCSSNIMPGLLPHSCLWAKMPAACWRFRLSSCSSLASGANSLVVYHLHCSTQPPWCDSLHRAP